MARWRWRVGEKVHESRDGLEFGRRPISREGGVQIQGDPSRLWEEGGRPDRVGVVGVGSEIEG